MSFRARFTALFFGVIAPVRPTRRERVTSTITDGLLAQAQELQLIEDGRKAVDDLMVRTHVERTGHFDVPRVGG